MTNDTDDLGRETPFARSYWVVSRLFLAGYYPGDMNAGGYPANLNQLVKCGIRFIVNLMEDLEVDHTGRIYEPYMRQLAHITEEAGVQVKYIQIPIKDLSIPSQDEMRNILDIIDNAISQQIPVYVHCLGGLGRTGTVVGCFLARHGIASGDEVLTKIKELRQVEALSEQLSPQTTIQRQFVSLWRRGK